MIPDLNHPLESSPPSTTKAQEIFRNAKPEYQALIRDILKEERDVMYFKRRHEIHQRLYGHIRRVIK